MREDYQGTAYHDRYQYNKGLSDGINIGIDKMAAALLTTSFARQNALSFAKVVIDLAEQLKEEL